ncbi:MAG: cytochrome c biogenesis protein ResB [Mariprofundaceae bacterium]
MINKMMNMLKPYYLRLGSMPLAIVMLTVLALASIIGTVLIQNQQQGDYLTQFGPLWYWVFHTLGLFDMYHTWWFRGLLGFLMVSLAVCLTRQVPRMLREIRSRKIVIADKSLAQFHLQHQWKLSSADKTQVHEEIGQALIEWESLEQEKDNRHYLRADKGRFHKVGYMAVHAAILVILIGGWAGVEFGFRGNMNVAEGSAVNTISFQDGSSVETLEMPFGVRCNDFYIDFYPTGSPKEFRSNLTIIDNGEEVLTSDIIVNEPLFYKGVYIYQSSFGDAGSPVGLKLFPLSGGREIPEIKSRVYETYQDESSGVSLEFVDFREYNIENMASSADEPKDLQDLGPSVEFILRGPGLKPVRIKSFMHAFDINGQNFGSFLMVSMSGDTRDYESFALGLDMENPDEWKLLHAFMDHLPKEAAKRDEKANLEAFKAAMNDVFGDKRPDGFQQMGVRVLQAVNVLNTLPWPFIPMLVEYEKVYYTGLQMTKDPGMNTVWVGSALLVLGLCIMFYVPHRRIWFVVEEKGEALSVRIAGIANRNKLGFEQEFNEILSRLEERFSSMRVDAS